MHLWPSVMLRDSFKVEYLKKVEWNLLRMNIEKRQRQEQQRNQPDCDQQKLLETDENDSEASGCGGGIAVIFREIFMILSCCYCCFCCGACIADEESS